MQTDSGIIRARNAGPERGTFPAIRDVPRSHDIVQYMVTKLGTMQAMSAQSSAAGGPTPPQEELFQGTTTNVRMKGARANATWSPNARGPYLGQITGVAPSSIQLVQPWLPPAPGALTRQHQCPSGYAATHPIPIAPTTSPP
jgi:hypothetical protein